jgi:hypothetical protein
LQRLVGTSWSVQLFREPIHWIDTARYLVVTLDAWLTLTTHINQVRKKVVQRMGVVGPLLNKSGTSIRNGVLLYRQLIHPMDYVCSI